MLIVKNKSNGVEGTITKDAWDKMSPKFKAIFNVKVVPPPKEVLEMEAAQKPQEQAMTETGQNSTQIENATKVPQRKKRAKKKQQNNTGNKN